MHIEKVAYKFENQYFIIHECEDGYGYSLFDKSLKLIDEGIYDDTNIDINKATEVILGDFVLHIKDGTVVDFDIVKEKSSQANALPDLQSPCRDKISYFVAECIEFPDLGEYAEYITLESAIKHYQELISKKSHSIPGIGLTLIKDGKDEYEIILLNGINIDIGLVNHIDVFRNNEIVQRAIKT